MARYLGCAIVDKNSGKSAKDLELLFEKRNFSPGGFLSGQYDPEFLQWLTEISYGQWGVSEDRVREKYGSVEIRNVSSDGKYFLTVVAYPELQAWFTWTSPDAHGDSSQTRRILALSSFKNKPLVFAGRLVGGAPAFAFPAVTLGVRIHALHYLWTPEFHDLDGDGVPEIWLRYSLARENGFSEVLDIYKMGDGGLDLLKEFEAFPEGIARRTVDGQVELGWSVPSRSDLPPMEYDRHRFERWEYRSGKFEKVSENEMPNIFKSKEWKKYVDFH